MVDTFTKRIILLNPTGKAERTIKPLAPRLKDLRGKVAGLIIVPMSTSGDFQERLGELLVQRYGVLKTITKWKVNGTKPSSPDFISNMVNQCDFVVVAVGT